MKCKRCRREIADNSVFCSWCGHKQITASDDVRVPAPQKKGNVWVAQVMVNGERKFVSAPTEKEYYAKARAVKSEQIEIKKAAPRITLGAAIDRYLKDVENVVSPSTLNNWKSYRKTRFADYMDMDIGYIPYQQMINKESKIVSAKTVSNSYDLVRHALDYAKFPRPMVKLPTIVKAERKWLDYEQIQTFTSVLRGKPYELGALLALHGLRRSELLHLTAEDIDVDNGIIRVRGASVVGEGNKLVSKKSNKNRTSTRTVHIVIPRLKELVRGKEGTLITTNPTTLYGSINGLCERNGLPAVGVHGLRHSWVSLCFHLHWDPQTVMREGGYSNMQTINEIYRHLAAQDANEDIKSMQEFFTT